MTADTPSPAVPTLRDVATMALTPERDSYDQYHDWHERLRAAARAALDARPAEEPRDPAALTVCPICGGTEHVDPLPGTVGRMCVKCCGVAQGCPPGPHVGGEKPAPKYYRVVDSRTDAYSGYVWRAADDGGFDVQWRGCDSWAASAYGDVASFIKAMEGMAVSITEQEADAILAGAK